MTQRQEIIERLNGLELEGGSHEMLNAICKAVLPHSGAWTLRMCEDLRDRLVRLLGEADSALAERYVELPKDADGEYIHVGDRLKHTNGIFTADDMTISIDGIWRAWDGENGHTVLLAKCRHHKQPTVEDVLEELLREYDRDDSELTNGEIIERFAAKLQLRGDAE